MFQALVAFLTVMSGYVFVSTWHRTRYLLLRQPAQRIYFRAAFWGVWLFVLALALALLLRSWLESSWMKVWEIVPDIVLASLYQGHDALSELVITALFICMVLGLFFGYFLNWLELLRRWPKDWKLSLAATLESGSSVWLAIYGLTSRRPLRRAIEYLNADLERILLNALREEKPICLTMADRKVYIGYLCGAIDPSDVNDMVRVLPYMSGYRRSESLELVITDYYDQLYEQNKLPGADQESIQAKSNEGSENSGVDQSDFEVALPIRDIRSCRLFDTGLYLRYQQEKRGAAA